MSAAPHPTTTDDLTGVIPLVAHRLYGEDYMCARESAQVAGDDGEAWLRPFRWFPLVERLMLDRYRQRGHVKMSGPAPS